MQLLKFSLSLIKPYYNNPNMQLLENNSDEEKLVRKIQS